MVLLVKKRSEIIISVPDLERCINMYCSGKYSYDTMIDQIYRRRCRNDLATDKDKIWRDANTHKFGYSPASLRQHLHDAEFKEIEQIEPPDNRKGDGGVTITFKAKK